MATVTKRGKSYRLRAYAGYDVDGRQIEKTKTWTPPTGMTEKVAIREANRQAVLFEESIKNGDLYNGKIKFSDFAELWFHDYAEKRLRPRTIAGYRSNLIQINAAIGHLPLEKIRPTHLMELYNSIEEGEPGNTTYLCSIDLKATLKQHGFTKAAFSKASSVSLSTIDNISKGKSISRSTAEKICNALDLHFGETFKPSCAGRTITPSTVAHYHHLISSILGKAVKWQYIPYNPCNRVDAPKGKHPKITYLDDDQAKHFVELLKSEEGYYRRPALILLLTGMRRGELLGLEWSDVDWRSHTIRIERTSQYIPKQGLIADTTKNKTSQRVIQVSALVLQLLQEQQRWQQGQALLLGDGWNSCSRIVTGPNGTAMYPDRLSRWFHRFVSQTDLPAGLHLHSLRHTYATLCIAKGVPLTSVAEQLGHATVATTATVYAHAIKSAQIAASRKVDDIFRDIL